MENNNYSLNGKYFLQTEGTAIDSNLCMDFAFTYLGQLEENVIQMIIFSRFHIGDMLMTSWKYGTTV